MSLVSKIFAIIRLIVFLGALAATAIYLFPVREFTPATYIIIFIAAIGVLLLLGILAYSVLSPGGGSIVSSAFDLEAIAAVVLGMVAVFTLGLAAFFTAAAEPIFIAAGLGFMAIYTFYIYRLIRAGLKGNLENEKIRKKYGELLEN